MGFALLYNLETQKWTMSNLVRLQQQKWNSPTSEIGEWGGSGKFEGITSSLVLESLPSNSGTSLISHKVAASFLAETDMGSFPFPPAPSSLEWCWPFCFFGMVAQLGDDLGLVEVFQVGTGVLEPARFPTRMARFNLYLRTKEDEDEDEQPRFLILHCLSIKLWSCRWFCKDIWESVSGFWSLRAMMVTQLGDLQDFEEYLVMVEWRMGKSWGRWKDIDDDGGAVVIRFCFP